MLRSLSGTSSRCLTPSGDDLVFAAALHLLSDSRDKVAYLLQAVRDERRDRIRNIWQLGRQRCCKSARDERREEADGEDTHGQMYGLPR
jgi:hypothetical protein